MPHPRISNGEIDRRGQEIYEHLLRDQVEIESNLGKQIVIDIETEAYEIDDDEMKAIRRLLAIHPAAALYGLRIGYDRVLSPAVIVNSWTSAAKKPLPKMNMRSCCG